MWERGWRAQVWSELDQPWDVIIIGGGITGAGILREAGLHGLRALLLEANDFAFGTSSRSSKLVHGGIRYLRERQFSVSREMVHEREWLLREAPHLVNRQVFLLPNYGHTRTPAWLLGVGVIIYDLMAPKWDHRHFSSRELLKRNPLIREQGLLGGQIYADATVDDSMLVLHLLRSAVADGGHALNYAPVEGLLQTMDGQVCGVQIRDLETGRTAEIQASAVINAAGPWSDELRASIGALSRLRKCRGSHLVFSQSRLPIKEAISLVHPRNNRAMFITPWEGTTIIGTTDIDHPRDWEHDEPFATAQEIEYTLEAIQHTLPGAKITQEDIISTFSGIRPLVRPEGSLLPSQVSRREVVWNENGLITITGGKLTIYRIMAVKALQAASARLRREFDYRRRLPHFEKLPELTPPSGMTGETLDYLLGRYGRELPAILEDAHPDELQPIPSAMNPWCELRINARAGAVYHLDDLLLRRMRLGIQLPRGGMDHIDRIRAIVQPELGWDDARWENELLRYQEIWQRFYSPAPVGIGQKVSVNHSYCSVR